VTVVSTLFLHRRKERGREAGSNQPPLGGGRLGQHSDGLCRGREARWEGSQYWTQEPRGSRAGK